MTIEEKTELMLLCGCIHDIREKCKGNYTQKQFEIVEKRLEKLINNSGLQIK